MWIGIFTYLIYALTILLLPSTDIGGTNNKNLVTEFST